MQYIRLATLTLIGTTLAAGLSNITDDGKFPDVTNHFQFLPPLSAGNISFSIDTKILDGKESRDATAAAPIVAIVQVLKNGKIVIKCTGSYLGDGWVMTAGHCLPLKKGEHHIYLGTFALNRPVFKLGFSITHKAPKPGFLAGAKQEYDIGLVKVEGTIPPYIKAGRMCLSKYKDIGGLEVKTYGYGRSKCVENYDNSQEVLRQATGTGISADKCRKDFGKSSKTVCAMFNHGGIPDAGDSGGPLLITGGNGKLVQVGVFSTSTGKVGLGCTDPTHPGVYTRISVHLRWISKIYPGVCIEGGTLKKPVISGKKSVSKVVPPKKKGISKFMKGTFLSKVH